MVSPFPDVFPLPLRALTILSFFHNKESNSLLLWWVFTSDFLTRSFRGQGRLWFINICILAKKANMLQCCLACHSQTTWSTGSSQMVPGT